MCSPYWHNTGPARRTVGWVGIASHGRTVAAACEHGEWRVQTGFSVINPQWSPQAHWGPQEMHGLLSPPITLSPRMDQILVAVIQMMTFCERFYDLSYHAARAIRALLHTAISGFCWNTEQNDVVLLRILDPKKAWLFSNWHTHYIMYCIWHRLHICSFQNIHTSATHVSASKLLLTVSFRLVLRFFEYWVFLGCFF